MIGIDREFSTSDKDYYQHEQKIFLEFYKKGSWFIKNQHLLIGIRLKNVF